MTEFSYCSVTALNRLCVKALVPSWQVQPSVVKSIDITITNRSTQLGSTYKYWSTIILENHEHLVWYYKALLSLLSGGAVTHDRMEDASWYFARTIIELQDIDAHSLQSIKNKKRRIEGKSALISEALLRSHVHCSSRSTRDASFICREYPTWTFLPC